MMTGTSAVCCRVRRLELGYTPQRIEQTGRSGYGSSPQRLGGMLK
jgi:hypothetical protein